MRRYAVIPLVVAALVAAAPSASARHWYRVGFGVSWGPWWGGGWAEPVRVRMPAPPDLAVVDTDVSPEDARVILDDRLIGTADDFDGYPDYLYLRPGRYTIRFELPGYQPVTATVDAEGGRMFHFDDTLVKIPGAKRIAWYDRPAGLPVGRVFGPRAETPPAASPEGPDVSLRPDLAAPAVPAAPASPGARPRGEPPQGARVMAVGALDLQVKPDNASVYVDGAFVGTAAEMSALERGLAVAAGSHKIDVMAPGYVARSLTVTVEEGAQQQVVVELVAGAGQS